MNMPGHCPVATAAGLVQAGQIADLPAVVNTWPVSPASEMGPAVRHDLGTT